MTSISQNVKNAVLSRPMLHEALREGIVSYAALAEKLKPQIEREQGTPVQEAAIVMALRRLEETLGGTERQEKLRELSSELIVKTSLIEIAVLKSPQLYGKLEKLHRLADYSKGDTLNIIHGNYEVSIITNRKHREKVQRLLEGETCVAKEEQLVSVALQMEKKWIHTPGTLFVVVQKLAWNNINIVEIVSTATELNLIVAEKDMTRTYNALQELLGGK